MTDAQTFEPDGRAIPFVSEGNGPALVLLAGQGLSIHYLGTLAHLLSEEDFRIIRIGTRRPAAEGAAVSIHDLANDVVDVLDHLQIKDAWIGGHAFGGSVARAVSTGHVDRVNGVLLLGVEGAIDATEPFDLSALPEKSLDAEVAELQQAARAGAQGELTAIAEGIPVLVIQGTDDTVSPVANGEALQAAVPAQVSVVTVDGGGYLFPSTHVGATSWAIEDYLDWD